MKRNIITFSKRQVIGLTDSENVNVVFVFRLYN